MRPCPRTVKLCFCSRQWIYFSLEVFSVRIDGRVNDELRAVKITPGVLAFADGSALIEMGKTKVLCAVTVENRVPIHIRGTGKGWVTAEYGMLPRSTQERTPRESVRGRPSGRTLEIQRLIGRSLRAITRLESLGERTLVVDCDVLQADGGTRTASITGAYIALWETLRTLLKRETIRSFPLRCPVAAVSVGIVGGEVLLDLCYEEDSLAEVDFNVVMTGEGEFVELQGTAETSPFPKERLDSLLEMAAKGVHQLFQAQEDAIRLLQDSVPS